MTFKKGYKPWNKGMKTGLIPKTAFKKGCIPWNVGTGKSRIRNGRNTKFKKGHQINKGREFSETHRKNMGLAHKDKKLSEETKEKMRGRKPWNYIDGRSKTMGPARYGDDWEAIRFLIYKRDNFACKECGITMNETRRAHHVHHIIPFFISFDNSPKNLITLCPLCHRKIESIIMRELKSQKVEV